MLIFAAMATKKKRTQATTSRAPRTGAVAAFILSQPAETKATAVVEAGKAAGLKFGANYVYMVRGRGRSAGAPEPEERRGAVDGGVLAARAQRALEKLSRKGVAPRATSNARALTIEQKGIGSDAERQLAALIVEVGTARSAEILQRVRDVLGKLSF